MDRKLGGLLCPFGAEAGSSSNTMWSRPMPISIRSGILIHSAVWPQGHNSHGPKIGGCTPFGGAGSTPNTVWPVPRPTSTPSGLLIRPAVWSQYTNVTDRQRDMTGQDRQRSDSIGRTVLQSVAQESCSAEINSEQQLLTKCNSRRFRLSLHVHHGLHQCFTA